MKKANYAWILLAAVFAFAAVALFAVPQTSFAACQDEIKTFSSPTGANCIRNGANYGPSGYCTLPETARQFCKANGYDDYVDFAGQTWGSTLYNDCGLKWTGSAFSVIPISCTNDPECPSWAKSITCKKAGQCTPISLQSSDAPDTVYLGDTFKIKCNFGPVNIPCITAIHDASGNCEIDSYDGSTATFNCKAKSLGLKPNYCNLFAYPQDSRCQSAQTNQIKSTNVIDRCTSHFTKKCVENAVYWFDSCGNKQELVQTCSASQTCQDGQCVNIACSNNSDCGTNGFTGSPFCKNGDVYKNYKTYVCHNPGTPSSSCTNFTEDKLVDECLANETCANGSCSAVACDCDEDCGIDGYIGNPFCQGSNVYQSFKTYTCQNPGTAASKCINTTTPRLKQTCLSGQSCTGGVCLDVECDSDSDCGTNGFVGNPYCKDGDVYKTYKTYACIHPGTSASVCTDSTGPKLVDECLANEICDGGQCITHCISHASKRCVADSITGSNLYWFDSCGNKQELAQDCGDDEFNDNYRCNGSKVEREKIHRGCANDTCFGMAYWQIVDDCSESGEICQDGHCGSVECDCNSDCGTNGFTGSPYCQTGDVYRDYKTYVCQNPGTQASACTNHVEPKLVDECLDTEICSGGACSPVTCDSDLDCGTSGYVGSPFCQTGDVYKNYKTFICHNPGTPSSSCSNSTEARLVDECLANETCANGVCNQNQNDLVVSCYATPNPSNINQTVTFVATATGGNGAYAYSWTGGCVGSSQVCTKSYAYIGNYTATINVTSGGQTASNVCSVAVNQQCSSHVLQKCVGNAVYWFDSCGNQQELVQTCTSAQSCINGQCQTIECDSDSDCGNNGYTGNLFCQGNNVYQQYTTYVCNNPGTVNSHCSHSTSAKLRETCYSGNVCSNGSCDDECDDHSYRQCYNGDAYWFDSCGNRDEVIDDCDNGCQNGYCSGQNINVQTSGATNTSNSQATLNGYLYGNYSNYNNIYTWFQWGTSSSYGNETYHTYKTSTGNFSQTISNLYQNTTYHFRAVAQQNNGSLAYGQDMTFTVGSSYYGNNLTVSKTVRNLTTGNSGWFNSVYASPSDTLMFMITVQANNSQNINNVMVRDNLPSTLIYKNQLIVSGSNYYNNYSGDITSGINLGTITSGQTITITYQAQVASAANFAYGTNTINNSVYVTSSDSGYVPVSNASVIVTRTGVYGVTSISTGLTNNFLVDSFFLPLAIALAGVWLFRSGMFFGVEKWVAGKKRNRNTYKAEQELSARIAQIRQTEGI